MLSETKISIAKDMLRNYNVSTGELIGQIMNDFQKDWRIILASASPRRKELLLQVGFEFEVIPGQCEEVTDKTEPSDVVKELSYLKAFDVFNRLERSDKNLLIIGADTVVVLDGEIMGKPKNDNDAFSMLSRLQGRSHSVITGVTMIFSRPGAEIKTAVFSKETKVSFYSMNNYEIKAYIDTKEPEDKAGAYAIQGRCAAYIESIEGDYNNVVGLPVAEICRILREQEE